MAHSGEDDVGGVSWAAFEVAAPEVAFGLQVSDDGLDGGAAAQLALDDTEDAALLAGNEDAAGILRAILPALLQRWSRFPGQNGGLAKVVSGFDYAASFSCSLSIA